MTLRPRSRAAAGQQPKHRISGRQAPARVEVRGQSHEQDVEIWSPESNPCSNITTSNITTTTGTGTKFSTAAVNLDTDSHDSSNPSKFSDGMSDPVGELGKGKSPTTSRGNKPHESDRMRPFVSQGDPSQFIVIGSIGNQRVRILVDTGATISFISSTLVPTLTPKPEVERSELSVVLGNSETQDTDHYVDVPLMIRNCSLPARLHLLQLPTAFDVIAGLDWLSQHDSHVHVRARSLEITNSVGKRILVAACGGVMSGLPKRGTSCEWGHLTNTLCFLQPTLANAEQASHRNTHERFERDMSHVDVKTRKDFDHELRTAESTQGALMLMDIRELIDTKRLPRVGKMSAGEAAVRA